MQRFTDLQVWQKGHALALKLYGLSRSFPPDERFGLTSQLRRAAVSVAANIAEGSKRRTKQEYARFLNLAEGSIAEVEYLLILARDLEYLPLLPARQSIDEAAEIARMLHGLRAKVERST
jgi:four helix bundle protein